MAETDCQRCKRDISKPALVRCQDGACPLKSRPARVSPTLAIGGTIAAILAMLMIAYWMSLSPAQSRHLTASVSHQIGISHDTPRIDTGGGKSWFDRLWKSDKPVVLDSGAIPMNVDTPDPRAATRVQSFSCDGRMSASRALICTRWPLAIADYNISLLYKDALGRSANPAALARARRAWLARLDKQGVDADAILALYEQWRKELDRLAG